MDFKLHSQFKPTGDQPQAIEALTRGLNMGLSDQVLLGVTGSGKTFTMANIIANVNRPTLVLAHNKTLAAQLCSEFREFFPENAVEYFISYYDYYQPEAYIAQTDTYIEKDSAINDEIERLRHSATSALSERRDVIVVSSVSCIYGLGDPIDYKNMVISLRPGMEYDRDELMRKLTDIRYERNDINFVRNAYRVRGDTLEVYPAYWAGRAIRIEFFGDEIDRISEINAVTGVPERILNHVAIYPASHYVASKEKMARAMKDIEAEMWEQVRFFEEHDKLLEAQRIRQRTQYDLEMLQEIGFCTGIENYSRVIAGRAPGTPPTTLLDYFPDDFILFVDESHVTLPQVHGMFGGDRARKENLVEYGFRLPAAKDNRPLRFEEFEQMMGTTVYISATPADYELMKSEGVVVEQLIRPTGLVDPPLEVRVTENQIDDLLEEIDKRVRVEDKVLITTITKRMAEELSKYFDRIGVRNRYIHSDIDTLERIQILEDLRAGMFDVLIGVNLLREGLDLPEVGLVAILDADKEGFLRNVRSITQIAGRAARHANGNVILYADHCTDSMRYAIVESNRRREKQVRYNLEHEMLPRQAQRSGTGQSTLLASQGEKIREATPAFYLPAEDRYMQAADVQGTYVAGENLDTLIAKAKEDMERAAKSLDFLAAAKYRDRMYELQKLREENRNR